MSFSNYTFSPMHYCKEGYLQRLRSKIIGWKSVYLILTPTHISWKKKNSDKNVKGNYGLFLIESCINSGSNEFILVFYFLEIIF